MEMFKIQSNPLISVPRKIEALNEGVGRQFKSARWLFKQYNLV